MIRYVLFHHSVKYVVLFNYLKMIIHDNKCWCFVVKITRIHSAFSIFKEALLYGQKLILPFVTSYVVPKLCSRNNPDCA